MSVPVDGMATRRTGLLDQPTWWAMFACAYGATAMIWIPLTLIQALDGMLFMATTADVVRDAALLWLLGLLPAMALSAIGWLVARWPSSLGVPSRTRLRTAWAIVLVPVSWACVWQAARAGWLWIHVTLPSLGAINPGLRLAIAALLVLALAVSLRRWGADAALAGIAERLYPTRWPAMTIATIAMIVVAAHPPTILRSGWPYRGVPTATSARPDIILISLDAMSANDASLCGEQGQWLPSLRAFARGSTCFSHDYASSNFTTPTTSTMETGLLPWSHFATQPDARVLTGAGADSVAGRLKEDGYTTVSVSDNLLASPRHRGTYVGWDRTDLVQTSMSGNFLRDAATIFPDTQLPMLVAEALSFNAVFDVYMHGKQSPYRSERTFAAMAQALAGTSPPRFVWGHSLPPHSPYLPPEDARHRLLPPGELERWNDLLPDNLVYAPALQPLVDKHRLRYRESLMAADARLGRFMAELKADGRFDDAIIVVTADHGESFEKGYIGHAGPLLHESLIRIPLLIKLPRQAAGQVIDMPVSEADLAPTLVALAGDMRPLARAEGRSLAPLLQGQSLPSLPVFSMTMEHQSRFRPLRSGTFAVIDGASKLELELPAGTRHLFDLSVDPAERNDMAASRPEEAARLEQLLHARIAQAEARRAHAVAAR